MVKDNLVRAAKDAADRAELTGFQKTAEAFRLIAKQASGSDIRPVYKTPTLLWPTPAE